MLFGSGCAEHNPPEASGAEDHMAEGVGVEGRCRRQVIVIVLCFGLGHRRHFHGRLLAGPVLLKLATNRVISPRLFAGQAGRAGCMPCLYCRKKQRQKEVRRSE